MIKINTTIDTDLQGRTHISAMIYWQYNHKPAHCLAQIAVLANDSVIILLSDLRTCSRYISLCDKLTSIADALWSELSDHLPTKFKAETKWFYRSGPHVSYDSYGVHELTVIHLELSKNGQWLDLGMENTLELEEEEQLLLETNIESVESSLTKFPKLPEMDPDDH